MTYTIKIPASLEAMAATLDTHLKTLHKSQEVQSDGSILQATLFPNGIADWLQAVFLTNFKRELMNVASEIPEIQSRLDAIASEQRELDELFSLEVEVE